MSEPSRRSYEKEVGQMSDNKKPEWFEMAEGDSASANVTKVNKKLPAIAVLVTGAVIATGAFFASASESDAEAEGQPTTSITSVDNSAPTTTTSPSGTPTAPQKITKPSEGGVPLPSENPRRHGDGDGDGDHKRWGDHPERDGDHEGFGDRDGDEGGNAPAIPSTGAAA